jgi:hypothetical protein
MQTQLLFSTKFLFDRACHSLLSAAPDDSGSDLSQYADDDFYYAAAAPAPAPDTDTKATSLKRVRTINKSAGLKILERRKFDATKANQPDYNNNTSASTTNVNGGSSQRSARRFFL